VTATQIVLDQQKFQGAHRNIPSGQSRVPNINAAPIYHRLAPISALLLDQRATKKTREVFGPYPKHGAALCVLCATLPRGLWLPIGAWASLAKLQTAKFHMAGENFNA
jgi:hypothetical protein